MLTHYLQSFQILVMKQYFPNTYKTVLLNRARYYIYQFKESPQFSSFALEDYKRGLRLMKSNLMSPNPGDFKDDRMRFV
jgi:hypothetical protein